MSPSLDRFYDRAREVLRLADQEAHRFNHDHVGTEHLLLGLIKEGQGVGARALISMGIDLRGVHLRLEKHMKSKPEMVSLEKLPFTPQAEKVLKNALEEATTMADIHIDTGHILLGLLREPEGIHAEVLKDLGITLGEVRIRILAVLNSSMSPEEIKGRLLIERVGAIRQIPDATKRNQELFKLVGDPTDKVTLTITIRRVDAVLVLGAINDGHVSEEQLASLRQLLLAERDKLKFDEADHSSGG